MLSKVVRIRRRLQDFLQRSLHTDVSRAGFYSPIVDRGEVAGRAGQVWAPTAQDPSSMVDLDFRPEHQVQLLSGPLGRYMREFQFETETPKTAAGELLFSKGNTQFGWLDARLLVGVLRHFAPARVIEVGSGFSTIILDSVARGYFPGQMSVTAIEPFPRPFLSELDQVQLLQCKVQDVPVATFEQLQANDVLFVDSSHVAKTGSDVNYLFFEVFPRLKPGVLIHVHDIWLPLEYPQEWVLAEARSWNEQYLLRALLTGSDLYSVELAGAYLCHTLRPELQRILGPALDDLAVTTGFWMRKTR